MTRHMAWPVMLALLTGLVTARPAPAQVMTTSGDFSVDQVGAARFVVPILVPPGTAGMVPGLSLAYASGAPNGIAGVGWSIEGLSTISRCPKTIPRQGVRDAIHYDLTDPLCLDGQPLVLVSGVHQTAGAVYRTEIDGLSRIVIKSANTKGALRIEVKTKSGLTMTYGETSDSRIVSTSSTNVRMWAVNKIEDTAGNYMAVTYINNSATGDYRPNRIDYGGNNKSPALPHYASVRFVYENRPDPVSQYSAGAPAKTTVRLSKIQGYVGSSLVTDYRLAYGTVSPATGASRLATLARCDGAGVCLPAVSFTWSGTTPAVSTLAATVGGWTTDKPNTEAFLDYADVTGDGLPDAVKFRPSTGALNVYRNTGSLNFTPVTAQQLVQGGTPDGSSRDGVDFFLVDINLDGKADAVHYAKASGLITVKLAGSNGVFSGGGGTSTFVAADGIPRKNGSTTYHIDFNDYNDDGYPDAFLTLVRRNGDSALPAAGSWIAPGLGNGLFGTVQSADWVLTGAESGSASANRTDVDAIISSDLNGDGRIDKTVIFNSVTGLPERRTRCVNTYLQRSGSPRFVVAQESRVLASGILQCTSPLTPPTGQTLETYVNSAGDVNGDGHADYYGYYKFGGIVQNTAMSAIFGEGDGTFSPGAIDIDVHSTSSGSSYSNVDDSDFFFFSDLNGDGLSDFVLVYTADDYKGNFDIHYARTGGGYTKIRTAAGFTGNASNAWVNAIDLDGDGVEEIVAHRDDGVARIWRQPGALPNRLTAVTDGLGATVQITYGALTDPQVYVKDSTARYPQLDLVGPSPVVKTVRTSDGIGGLRTTSYRYGGLKAEVNGRAGQLGVRWRETTQVEAASLVREEYSQIWPYVGMTVLRRTQVKPAASYVTVNQASTTYRCVDTGSVSNGACVIPPAYPTTPPGNVTRWFFPYAWKTTETTNELNGTALPTVTTITSYDRYGNALVVNQSTDDGFSKRTVSTYDNFEATWFLGRLTRTEVTAKSPDLPVP